MAEYPSGMGRRFLSPSGCLVLRDRRLPVRYLVVLEGLAPNVGTGVDAVDEGSVKCAVSYGVHGSFGRSVFVSDWEGLNLC